MTINGTTNHSSWTHKLEVREENVNIANNNSQVVVDAYIGRGNSGSYMWGANISCPVSIEGIGTQTIYYSNSGRVDVAAWGWLYIGSVTFTVTHNNDGSKYINISSTFINSVNPTAGSASGGMTLTTIPRATSCPGLNGYIEDSYNIPLNPASNTFTHAIKVNFGKVTGYINASGKLQSTLTKLSNSNIPFTIPTNFYNEFNGKYGTGTLTLYTYNGTTLIGTTTGTLTANCSESKCKPEISGTIKDINTITLALTGDENKVVKGYSTLKATLTLDSSITKYDLNNAITSRTINGVSFTGTEPTVLNAQNKNVSITLTNKRGFSNTVILSTTGELIDYFTPQININSYRIDQTSANVKLTYSGKFFNKTFGNVANSLTMKWYYKEENASSWTLGGNITPTFNTNNILEATIDCGTIYDYRKNYRFKVEATDKLSSNIQEQTVTAGIPNHDWGKEHFQHHTQVYDLNGNEILGFEIVDEW